MKKRSIVAIILVVLISLSLKVDAQDVIKLKSGRVMNVKILKEYPDSVRFIVNDDPDKPERVFSREYIESIESTESVGIKQYFKGSYESVVTVDSNISQNDLYFRAREWVALKVNSVKDVIQMDDKDAGMIIFKPSITARGSSAGGGAGSIEFTFKIQVKKGRYRYSVTNFYHKSSSGKSMLDGGRLENEKPACGTFYFTKASWNKMKTNADQTINQLLEELASAMNKKSNGEVEKSW